MDIQITTAVPTVVSQLLATLMDILMLKATYLSNNPLCQCTTAHLRPLLAMEVLARSNRRKLVMLDRSRTLDHLSSLYKAWYLASH